MNQFTFSLLFGGFGGTGGTSPQGGASSLISLLPIVAIFGIMYFLMIRPQSKKQKETKRMLDELKKGDKVVTIGGVHGVVQSVRESSVIIKVDENCKLEFSRSAIGSVKEKGDGGESADQ